MSRSSFCSLNIALSVAVLFLYPFSEVQAKVVDMKTPDETVAFADPVSDAELDSSRGAFVPLNFTNINNINDMNAIVSNNTVIGGATGNNIISNSFNGSQGLVDVILNSGNNVLIQSSTIVNTTFVK